MAYIGPGLPGVAQPAPAPPAAPPASTASASQLSQIELARKIAAEILNPQKKAAQSILTAADNAALNTRGAYDALAQMRQGQVGDVQQAYQTAAGSTAAFSKGYSDAMQAKVNGQAQDINSFLEKMGAPSGAMLSTSGSAGDVVYGLTGEIPASALAAQGAAAGAYAAGLPGQAKAAGIAAGNVLLGKGQQLYADSLSAIDAKAPSVVDSVLTRVQKTAAAEKKSSDDRSKIDTALSTKMGFLVNSWGEAITGADGVPRSLPKDAKPQRVDLALSENLGYYSDSFGKPILKDGEPVTFRKPERPQKISPSVSAMVGYVADETGAPVLNKAGKVVEYKKPTSSSDSLTLAKADQDYYTTLGIVSRITKVNGAYVAQPVKDPKTGDYIPTREAIKDAQDYTPKQLNTFRAQAFTFADAAYKGVPPKYNADRTVVVQEEKPKLSYLEALAEATKIEPPTEVVLAALNKVYPKNERDSLPPGGVYKMGVAGVFKYDDVRELTQNNTGAPIASKITPDDPRYREAVNRAIDPKTLKPLTAAQKNRALGGKTSKRVRNTTPRVEVTADADPFARAVLSEADDWLGTPYSWGGGNTSGPTYGIEQGKNTKGFDCSSFAQYLYAKAGTTIPRTTYEQWRTGESIGIDSLRPGDLVFFNMGAQGPGHVGIYTGDNKFIHAPKTGDVVKISSLDGYYRRGFVGGRRYAQDV